MNTVSTDPGSVERYAEHIRTRIRTIKHITDGLLDTVTLAWTETILTEGYLSHEEAVRRIRNVLAAAAMVRAEVYEARR